MVSSIAVWVEKPHACKNILAICMTRSIWNNSTSIWSTLNYRCLIFVRLSKVKQQAMKFDSLHENLGLIQDTFQTKIFRTQSKGYFYNCCISDTKITLSFTTFYNVLNYRLIGKYTDCFPSNEYFIRFKVATHCYVSYNCSV